jgi:DNA modification methylase
MTDIVMLLPGNKLLPDAAFIKRIIKVGKASVIAIHSLKVLESGGLDREQFSECHMQYGIDLASIDPDFRLRDIILVRTSSNTIQSNFQLFHLWNWPDSTYDIEAIRIPHKRKTDPRNNPLGKNPGNVWTFSQELDDGNIGTQMKLFEQENIETICDGSIETNALGRIIFCHSLKGDTIHFRCSSDDLGKIKNIITEAGRIPNQIVSGKPDAFRKIEIPLIELPITELGERESGGGLLARGKIDTIPYAKYYIVDCRQGLKELPLESINDVVTSPPYNIGYDPFNVPKPSTRSGEMVAPERTGYEDELAPGQYHCLIKTTMESLNEKMDGISSDIFLNIKNNYGGSECRPPFWILKLMPKEWILSDILIWRYDISYDPAKNKYKPYYEWIFRLTKGEVNYCNKHRYLRDFYIPILKGNSRERKDLKHPAIFPKDIVKSCLAESSHEGLVLDPFLGSGTTLAVAWELGRSFIGFEINATYVSDIELRLARAKRYFH